jgi:polyisoprenoid-binding protein YceI
MSVWNIDSAHANANFAVRHMMVSTVRGRLGKVEGTLHFDPDNPEDGSVEVTIDAASIDTGISDRDNHLRSPDFLNVEEFPTITFKSTKVDVTDEDEGKVYGDLTIRDVTRPVVLEVEYLGVNTNPFDNSKAVGFEAITKINREDWGLEWNVALETGGWLVGKDIKITIDLEAVLETETENA